MNSIVFWSSIFFLQFLSGLFWGGRAEMGPLGALLLPLALQLGIVFWLHRDMRLHHYHPAFDSRTFLFVAWPLVGPYYLFRSRGWKAIIPIAVFVALLVSGLAMGYAVGSYAVGA